MEAQVKEYEEQLLLVQQQLAASCNDDERQSLSQLEGDIKELILLTKGNDADHSENVQDDLDVQYALFKAELTLAEDQAEDANSRDEKQTELEDELDSLEGLKCQAPFRHAWCDEPVYHNALVFTVKRPECLETSDDIQVTVMFTHPTHKDMMPCPYFLEGECKFSAEKCRFSHGESVPLQSLKEYKEPSALLEGTRVMVKQDDGVWAFATVISLSEETCSVKMECSSREVEAHLTHIFPTDIGESNESNENESMGDEQLNMMDILRQMPKANAIGSWEQFTKGFGSRMMSKMGYVHGAGLGVHAEGRVEPVPALIYPPGKSLDHCMSLRERAGGGDNLFHAERKARQMQKKHENAMARAYHKEKNKKDMFTFLNNHLSKEIEASQQPEPSSSHQQLRSVSKKSLNLSSFQIAENVMKLEKEKKKLDDALARHAEHSPVYAAVKEKIRNCQEKLTELQASENRISKELNQRDARKKLSIF